MKGYKAFDKDLKCKDFQYEIGQTYEMSGKINCGIRGFHFCKDLTNCYIYYDTSDDTRICEVEAIGVIKDDGITYCTDKIKILSEVENPRIKSNVNASSMGYCNSGIFNGGNWNSGKYNSGNSNSGSCNSGNCNSGDDNPGNYNTGDCNNGDGNSGNYNTGVYNSGNFNIGSYNSGVYNNGDWNSGDWNKGDHHAGIFNCEENPKIKIFDKESGWTMKDWKNSRAYAIMIRCPFYTHSEYDNELKKIFHKATLEDIQKWWDELIEDDKNTVKSLPNFDAEKFYLCTGIKV